MLATVTFTDLNPPHEITITSPMNRLLSTQNSANLEFDIVGPGDSTTAAHNLRITAIRQDGATSSVNRDRLDSTLNINVPVGVLPGNNTYTFTFTAFLPPINPTEERTRPLSESVQVARNRLLNVPDRTENTDDQTPIVFSLANPNDEPDSDPVTARIQDIPADGRLEQFNGTPITTSGTVVTDSQLRVRFVPRPNNAPSVSLSFVLNDGFENSRETTVQIMVTDIEPPPPGQPDLVASFDTGPTFVANPDSDDITRGVEQAPPPEERALRLSVDDVEPGASVRLFRDGIPQGPGPVPDSNNDGVVTITIPAGSQTGTFQFTARQIDPGGNISDPSSPLAVAIDMAVPLIDDVQIVQADPSLNMSVLPTQVTPDPDPTFQFDITEQHFSAGTNQVLLELVERQGVVDVVVSSKVIVFGQEASDRDEERSESLSGLFGPGPHQATIRATDTAGNVGSTTFDFFVTQPTEATVGAPSTPVFSSYYDINAVAGGDLEPWTMAFDNTTQTVWFTMEKGKRVGHFDPASQTLQVYDLSNFGVNSNNPHGIFFDFDSHLTPRVWFAHRNGNGVGRLSYLDVAADQFVTFDFGTPALEALGVRAAHAVVVDQRGTVWVTSEGSNKLLEIDFDQGSQSGFNLNSRTARFKVHDIPVELFAPEDAFEPHGIKVVLNDEPLIEVGPDGISRTYLEVFAWFTSQGPNGRVALLRTFQQVLGPGSPKQDEWTTWDLSLALLTESSDDNPRVGHALFVETDDNETPGNPRDDKIVIADPGFRRAGMAESPAGVVRVLDPRAYFANAGVLTSPVETWRVPSHPGAPLNHQFADTIQPFVDRGGTIFFADRTSGVGRFNPADPEPPSSTINAPILRTILPPVGISAELTGVTVGVDRDSLVLSALSLTSPENTNDHSQVTGFDQYVVAGPDAGNAQGQGLFRAFLNAGSIFYGSIAQNDALSTTVFAETARRQMASVVSPTQLHAGVVRGRMAFQVLRDGRVILTGRGDGVILDRQIDLTQLLRQNAANNAIPGFRMSGDPNATIDGNGVVSIFGLADDGTLLVYQYQGSWNHDSLFAANNWTAFKLEAPAGQLLIGDPTAFADSTGRAKAMVTTNDGHLLLYEAIRSSSPTDLFQEAGGLLPVYSSVGVVVQGNRVFAHGTNQRGELIQYSYLADAPNLVVATTVAHVAGLNPAQTGVTQPRDAFVFQAVDAILAGGKRHVFAMDGNSRLVHFEFDTDAPLARVTNVTNVAVANNQSFGYFNFQQPFGGRTYTELAPVVGQDGTVYIYGTNGRDLIEFKKLASGGWQAANLTNDIFATDGASRPAGSRIGANEVFGAPTAYVQPDGERHILQINADGEVVEYFYTPQTSPPRFHTQNINLAGGNQFSGSSQVSVSVTPAGVLVVTGDSGANGVAITGTGAPGQYVVTGLDLGGTPTAVNGLPNGTVTVDGVFTTIDVNLGDGDDYVSIDNAFLGGSIYIRTGSGNDTVQVGTRQIVTMREDMVIDLAQGNDQLDLQRSYVVRHLVVDGGDGDDSLRPNNASTLRDFVLRSGNGADTLIVRQVAVVGSWLIDAGADSDHVSLTNSAATGAAAFFLRDGNDSIALDACFFNSSFLIDGDGGQDSVEMSGVIANTDASLVLGSGDDQARVRHSIIRTLVIDGADGNDRAEISTSLLDDLFASLGAGDDHLSLITNRIRRSHFLDGGPGSDELLARSNDPSALSSTQFERRSS